MASKRKSREQKKAKRLRQKKRVAQKKAFRKRLLMKKFEPLNPKVTFTHGFDWSMFPDTAEEIIAEDLQREHERREILFKKWMVN